ncbi:type III-A CRISPR-associated protein Cas10/Csm1 [Leptothoe sp. EHU-05/26/07-4]
MSAISSQIALQVFQQAFLRLAKEVNSDLSYPVSSAFESSIQKSQDHFRWPNEQSKLSPLRLIFDSIKLKNGGGGENFWPAWKIVDTDPLVPYPVSKIKATSDLEALKLEIKNVLDALNTNEDDWKNLSLLSLILEKYGSYVSFGESDASFFDLVKMTAAVASASGDTLNAKDLCLIAGEISGIQPFIYTIASDGALKSLRARSFLLELITEEVVQQLLSQLKLPRTNVIYAGASKCYILAPAHDSVNKTVTAIKDAFNNWFLKEYQGRIFLGLDSHCFPASDVGLPVFANHWQTAIKLLHHQKNRKFDTQISNLLKAKNAHEPCKVCHRDDVKRLANLNKDDPTSVNACETCRRIFRLGRQLLQVKAIVRSQKSPITPTRLRFKLGSGRVFYNLFDSPEEALRAADGKPILLVNNWDIEYYKTSNVYPLLLGNYAKPSKSEFDDTADIPKASSITAAEMADQSKGIKRVGYLRMDVDRLGQIFANGLNKSYTLPKLSGLSRQMSYFFKVYLNSLAKKRSANLPKDYRQLTNPTINAPPVANDNLLFIYAGGDDLFVSGAWNEVVEFGFDVYQSFRAYTGQHSGITLSGGISLSVPKYPLYQSADDSGDAESTAKGNGRDSLTLFGQTFKWQQWLGYEDTKVSDISVIPDKIRSYLKDDSLLELYGILPFVNILNQVNNLPHSFVQNLLVTAQLQEQHVKARKEKTRKALKQPANNTDKTQLKEKMREDIRDIQYFLHLPRVAYTLARLPNSTQKAQDMKRVTSSLKSPYNAPYFRAIATWLDLLNRSSNQSKGDNVR